MTSSVSTTSTSQFRKSLEDVKVQYKDLTVLRRSSKFQSTDSPMAALYRMSDFLCVDDSNQLMLETHYFWSRLTDPSWQVSNLSDPLDPVVERYAVLASLAESLALAFNWRIELGTGSVSRERYTWQEFPSWTRHVPRLEERLVLCEWDLPVDGPSNPFSKRNIVANAGNLFSI